eukprot:scaffold152400_cov16-Tisochrysis_lutea.AAC.3
MQPFVSISVLSFASAVEIQAGRESLFTQVSACDRERHHSIRPDSTLSPPCPADVNRQPTSINSNHYVSHEEVKK